MPSCLFKIQLLHFTFSEKWGDVVDTLQTTLHDQLRIYIRFFLFIQSINFIFTIFTLYFVVAVAVTCFSFSGKFLSFSLYFIRGFVESREMLFKITFDLMETIFCVFFFLPIKIYVVVVWIVWQPKVNNNNDQNCRRCIKRFFFFFEKARVREARRQSELTR